MKKIPVKYAFEIFIGIVLILSTAIVIFLCCINDDYSRTNDIKGSRMFYNETIDSLGYYDELGYLTPEYFKSDIYKEFTQCMKDSSFEYSDEKCEICWNITLKKLNLNNK